MKIRTFTVCATLVFAMTGPASANPGKYQNISPSQQSSIEKIYSEYDHKTSAIQQSIIIKQSELDALLYEGDAKNTSKIQGLMRELGELKAQRYAAQSEMRGKLEEIDMDYADSRMSSHHGMMNSHDRGYGHGCW